MPRAFTPFTFTVGNREQHRVDFFFDKFLGNLTISVDGQLLVSDFLTMSFSTVKRYEFEVGTTERHRVVIEKIRPVFLAGFRRQQLIAYVDGHEVARSSV